MKFKVDENLPVEVAEVLRDAGHDAVTVVEEGLGGREDEAIAGACRREGRVLVTLDVGFADIRGYPPGDYKGLMVLRLRRQDKWHVLGVVERVMELLTKEPLEGRLWIVEEARVRIRGGGKP